MSVVWEIGAPEAGGTISVQAATIDGVRYTVDDLVALARLAQAIRDDGPTAAELAACEIVLRPTVCQIRGCGSDGEDGWLY